MDNALDVAARGDNRNRYWTRYPSGTVGFAKGLPYKVHGTPFMVAGVGVFLLGHTYSPLFVSPSLEIPPEVMDLLRTQGHKL